MFTRICALATLAPLLLWNAPAGLAEPEQPEPAPPPPAVVSLAESPTLPLVQLGAGSSLAFYGPRGSTSLGFPVPAGLTPVALNATLQVPLNVRTVFVTVTQDDRTIARVELPPADMAPVVIPLNGVRAVNQRADVTVTTTFAAVEGYCFDPLDPLRFVDGTVSYAGTEAPPTTVADFLPPILRKLTIGLPANPSQAESNAAVRLATAVVAHYGSQNPDVAVVPLAEGTAAPAGPSAPLERQVVVSEGPTAGLSLQSGEGVPVLTITGSGDNLTNQIRLLTNDLLPLALSSQAVAPTLSSDTALPGDTATLEELGQSDLSAAWLSPGVNVGIDQTRFGHPIQDVRVHLIGSYSPVPRDFGGQLVAMIGGRMLDHWATDDSGVIDRWVNVPNDLLQRYTNVAVKLNLTGNANNCGDFQPVMLTIDNDSQVATTPAKPPVPQGFQSLPQTLMPRVRVGIGTDALGDTVRAVSILVALQRMSSVPLDANVSTVRQAIDSTDPAIVIAADGWTDKKITLPVAASDTKVSVDGVDSSGKPTSLTLGAPITFASLQTVFDGQRSVLVATSNGAPAQLDELLNSLNAEPGAWAALEGRAVVSVPGRERVIIPNPTDSAKKPAAAPQRDRLQWAWWVAGVIVGLAAITAAVSLFLSRRESVAAHRVEAPRADGEPDERPQEWRRD